MSGLRVWIVTRESTNPKCNSVCPQERIRAFCQEKGYEVVGSDVLRGSRAATAYTLKKIAKAHNISYFVTSTIKQVSENEEDAALIFQELLEDCIIFKFSDEPYMSSITIVSIYRTYQELKEHGFKYTSRRSKRKQISSS